jgi:hypothetical protein
MASLKRSRVELEPLTRQNFILLRRQRARQLLEVSTASATASEPHVPATALPVLRVQRCAADLEYRQLAAQKESAASSIEERARLEAVKHAAEDANADSELASSTAVALVDAATKAEKAEAAVKVASKEIKKHAYKIRSLIMKQVRERSALVYALGTNLKEMKAEDAAGVPDGEDGEAAEADEERLPLPPPTAVSTLESKGGVPVSYTSGGTMACAHCGTKVDKLMSVECSECHRYFCGFGGTGLDHARGGPCIDLYQCSCKSRLCHECYTAGVERRSMHWGFCESCSSWMCVKETSGRAAACKFCGLCPVCRSCRGHHEKTCPHRQDRRDSDEEDEFTDEEDY